MSVLMYLVVVELDKQEQFVMDYPVLWKKWMANFVHHSKKQVICDEIRAKKKERKPDNRGLERGSNSPNDKNPNFTFNSNPSALPARGLLFLEIAPNYFKITFS
jgi:hypothetical protein